MLKTFRTPNCTITFAYICTYCGDFIYSFIDLLWGGGGKTVVYCIVSVFLFLWLTTIPFQFCKGVVRKCGEAQVLKIL